MASLQQKVLIGAFVGWSTNWCQQAKQTPLILSSGPWFSARQQAQQVLPYLRAPLTACMTCIVKMWPSHLTALSLEAAFKISCQKSRPPAQLRGKTGRLWLFVQLLDFQSLASVMKSVRLAVGFFRHVRLPQKELVQEGVDRVGTLHHNHVTSFINDFQECKQEDLGGKTDNIYTC